VRFGRSVQNAFDQALSELLLHGILEDATPELHVRAGVEASDLVLVRPPVYDQ